ncbi:MAG: type IV pilus twitching motility protein PilT [Patescibacteria group bacterium]
MKTIPELLQIANERKASDLHLIPSYFPTLRVNEELYAIRTEEPIMAETAVQLIYSIMSEDQRKIFQTKRQFDFGYTYDNRRYRVNVYHVRNMPAATIRVVPPQIKSVQELMLPTIFSTFAQMRSGLVLITGPTGEGKSTSLAAMINEINMNMSKHIITIEDPIEYVYPIGKSIVSQRELNSDTYSFADALKAALREDPDVVLIGEMRDLETTQTALTIAETGHLVFSTLHTSSTAEAINRIIDIFPTNQQSMVRTQLSTNLKAVVAQRLLPSITMSVRMPAVEILLNTSSVSTAIREGKIHLIDNMLETGEEEGMLLFEKYLYRLYQQGQISRETAFSYAMRPQELEKFIT